MRSQLQVAREEIAKRELSDAAVMLRARYLAVLLRAIERGDTRPETLDRFERIAGLA